MYEGSVQLKHPTLHSFRNDSKLPHPTITRRSAILEAGGSSSLRNLHSVKEPTYSSVNTKNRDFVFESSDANMKINPSNLDKGHYNFEHFESRLSVRNDNCIDDASASDRGMGKHFNQFSKAFTTKASAWKPIVNYASEPYVNGFEIVGNLGRVREKLKEIGKPFIAASPSDVLSRHQLHSNSKLSPKIQTSTHDRVYQKSLNL